ncbi:Heavy-metal-associated domain [Musa troglodytarum]|uniref:Heavy-metal-associated domain n=1 Tax=Musa troglodytarum TaxID=320322 RepID=A0A9E7FCJ1_9LILI|nr:Heavy-metal-associated domain [Musa troglodytarum]
MGKGEDFELLKIQTHTLKVNIHCDGCKLKVKKLLHRTEGVFSVSIDVEEQKVTVSGNVDCETLIRKLIKAGKHTELWTQKINQTRQLNQQHMKDANKNNNEQDKQGLMRGLKAFKSQHNKLSPSSSDEEDFDDDDDDDDDEDVDYDEEEEEDDDDDMQNLDSKMKQTNFMRQANNAPSNTKQNGNGNGKAGANAKIGCNGKGGENANQNHIKSPNEPQQKGTNAAANNRVASGNPKVQGNNGVMGLGPPGLVGGNNGCLPGKAFKGYTGHPPQCGGQYQSPVTANMQGYQTHPSSSMVNNLRGHNKVVVHESRYMQPQMMHLRTPQISPYAGYYNCYPSPHHLNNQVDNEITI